MKRLIILLLFAISFHASRAQWGQVNNISWIPSNPTTTDTVKIIADCTLGYMPCPLTNYVVTNPVQYVYDIQVYHCVGALAALCNAMDTLTLGVLPAGWNYVTLMLHSGQDFGLNCISYSVVDSFFFQVEISGPTDVKVPESNNQQVVFAWNGELFVPLASSSGNTELELYSPDGKRVFRKMLGYGEKKINPHLSPGIYFYKLKTGGAIYHGRVFSD